MSIVVQRAKSIDKMLKLSHFCETSTFRKSLSSVKQSHSFVTFCPYCVKRATRNEDTEKMGVNSTTLGLFEISFHCLIAAYIFIFKVLCKVVDKDVVLNRTVNQSS